jgi:hypothetical protein
MKSDYNFHPNRNTVDSMEPPRLAVAVDSIQRYIRAVADDTID